ncbi:unnamed protein product [Phytophthora lilii]|uniref:Unnamed protein product n=1 Tax=Phytophthora lilii TaxID=2077276 RepID=A0A9W6U2U8_9STRA|nr:unnamed protein product [Phytophthora lilii]
MACRVGEVEVSTNMRTHGHQCGQHRVEHDVRGIKGDSTAGFDEAVSGIALENHTQWSVIAHRLFSLDRNYDRAAAPNVVVQTEATPLECPLLTFGGLATKRQAAAAATLATRLDVRAALPEDATHEAADTQTKDASWCVSHLVSGCHFSVAAVVQPRGTTLLAWGLNTNGELGNGTMTSSPTPQQVVTFPMQFQREPLAVAHVSCGKHHVAVITGQAKLFTWGNNKYGQLGLGDFQPRTQPEEVHFALATLSSHRRALRVMHTVQRGGINVTHVACGAAHTLFVTHQQQILGMGYNQAGQLGLSHCLQQYKGWRSCTPIAVESLRDQSILDLAAGQNHSACALSNGDVYTWGCGDDGRLGDGKLGEGVATPTLITLLREVSVRARAVRCGARHMAVISDSDLVYIWGANDFGQLGCKDNKPRSRPFLLATPALFAEGVDDIALGEFHTTCVTFAGKAYTWGLNLRDNSALVGSHVSPQLIDLPEKERVRKISCGWTHTNIVTHMNADEASASGQGTNFDRKIERERLLNRKAEVGRWREFVSASVATTAQETKQKTSCGAEQRSPVEKPVSETNVLPVKYSRQSTACNSEQNDRLKIKHPFEELVTAYVGQGMKDAEKNVVRVLHAARRNIIRSARRKRDSNSFERQSQQLKGIFYQNQLRPPELPTSTILSPPLSSSSRQRWSIIPTSTLTNSDWHPVTVCTPFQPIPPAHTPPPSSLPIGRTGMVQNGCPARTSGAVIDTHAAIKHSAPTLHAGICTKPATGSVRANEFAMADAYRAKASASSSAKAVYGGKAKPSRLTAPKNQQSPGTSVLPKIDRRGEVPQKPSVLLSPNSAKNGGLSILLPPRQPSKDATTSEESSPTFHGDELDGPSAKAAWCTPRNPAPELPTGSHVAAFFAAPETSSGYDSNSAAMPTPLRLQSVEDSISANEERYHVDMEQLASKHNKFLEISTSANQHLEHMQNQLPNISEAFDKTAYVEPGSLFTLQALTVISRSIVHRSALQNLSSDIATLQQQHETAKRDMTSQFETAISNNADEMVSLSEAHANETKMFLEAHERELQNAENVFREKIKELEDNYAEMEKKYLDELRNVRQTSDSQMQALQDSNRMEREERERSAKATLEAVQTKAQEEFDNLRSSAQAAYTDLQERSQANLTELQQTSADELAAIKQSLTTEIVSLKQSAAANLAALADRSARELQEHREHSNDALHRLKYFYAKEQERLLEKSAEAIARLRMFETEQSTRMEIRRCQETKALSDELEATKIESSTQIAELHRRYTAELEVLRATSEAEKALLLQSHASETESIKLAATQGLSETVSYYDDRLHSMAEAHATEVAQNKEEASQAREAMIIKYESDLASLQKEQMRERDALILHYETELESLKRSSREEHDKKAKLHETQVAQLWEAHSSRVLSLEMTMRQQNKQAEDIICEKDAELDYRQGRIDTLEATELALKKYQEQYAEQSLELIEQKNMAMCELESELWRLDQLNLEKDTALDATNRSLKAAEEDLQVKTSTILELTFVVKSRDDEIEKLRNALLDTVQTVNTKTEILELTTETLSSKAKELEATKNALRLESGKLSMVEESMSQKVGMLENTELKMESMRLNMENMRLEIKRMQMDMKLQLEHTEGEIELKNGEIRRLHGTQSELKQKNDFCQQTIERLEESLAFAQRQGEESQRRIDLLRLEAAQSAEEMKRVCDELLGKEQDLVIMSKEKHTISTEKQRLQIQFNNLTHLAVALREKIELHSMHAEDIQHQCQRLLKEISIEKDERMRSEKHLHMLELSAAKDMIHHLEGVEERLSDTSLKLDAVTSEKNHLELEIQTLSETLKWYENTDQHLQSANEDIALKTKIIEDKVHELADLNHKLCISEAGARHLWDISRMEIEDSMSHAYRTMCSNNELVDRNSRLESSLSSLQVEKEQLMLSLGQEKRDIVRRAENLQEQVAGLRKEGVRAASELNDVHHALSEKKRELEYLQENLGEQTSDTRKVKSTLDTLTAAHTDLQAQFASLSDRRERDNKKNLNTIQSLQQNLESKTKECEALQQALDIQRKELDLLMAQHDSHVMQLTDGHRSEAVQLIESHRAQIAQMNEDHLNQVSKLTENHLIFVSRLKDDHLNQVNQSTEERHTEITRLTDQVSRLTEEHHREISRLENERRCESAQLQHQHQVEIDRLTDELRFQASELTVDRLTQITEQRETHRTEVGQLQKDHIDEIARLIEAHRAQLTQLNEAHKTEVDRFTEINQNDIARLKEEHAMEVARMAEENSNEVALIKEGHQRVVDRLTDDHSYEVSEMAVDRLGHITEQSETHRNELIQLSEKHRREIARLTEGHLNEMSALKKNHLDEVGRLADDHSYQVSELTVERLSHITVQTDEHLNEVARIEENRDSELAQLARAHQDQITQLTEEHFRQTSKLSEGHINEIARIERSHDDEICRLKQNHSSEVAWMALGHANQITELSHDHRMEVSRLEEDRDGGIARLKDNHRNEVDQLIGAHRNYVMQLRTEHYDGLDLLQEEYEGKFKEIDANFVDKSNEERIASRHVEIENQHLRHQQQIKTRAIDQQQILLKQAADERVRVICAHSLEVMTMQVAFEQEMESVKKHAAQNELSYKKELVTLRSQNSQMTEEHIQTHAKCKEMELIHSQKLSSMESEHSRMLAEMKQQHNSETAAASQKAQEQLEQAIAEHKSVVEQLNVASTQSAELMRLRLTEEHLTKVNELLERSRVEEERHAAAMAAVTGELNGKLTTLKTLEEDVVELNTEISTLHAQLQSTKQEVSERDAVVAAKNATIENVRKELNLLLETNKTTRSSEQFVALLRQQLETHVMEVYHVELKELTGFVLEDEKDLLGCLKGLFALRCYRGVAPQGSDGRPESNKAVFSVDDLRDRLREYDGVYAALGPVQTLYDGRTPSHITTSLLSKLGRLKLHVSNMFITSGEDTENETISTDSCVQLLQNLAGLFEILAIPNKLENAFLRSGQLIDMLKENEKLMLDAKASCLRDDIHSMKDIGNLFGIIDQVLARAREVTRSDKFIRLGDLTILFDEWEALYKELDRSIFANDNEYKLPHVEDTSLELVAGNYLRSSEILAYREEAVAFVQRCKNALQLTANDDMSSPDDIVEAISQLVKILHHFQLIQPKLGSPRHQPTNSDPTPSLENKVAAVLAFVEELQFMADFAQNILNDEGKEGDLVSNESSSSSLGALRAMTRTPSPVPTLDELQIDVDLAVDDTILGFDQNLCEFSNEEGNKQREAFFSLPEEKSSSRSPSAFLSDSLMDISLVMSDHHRLLYQTARWVAKSRQSETRNQEFTVGAEISRLVREHCALLSLSRRLFKMKDPRRELVSLLEAVALLERLTQRLALFQMNSVRESNEMSARSLLASYGRESNPSESATSLSKSDIDSIESLSRPILASIGDMARHLQDYDYFLQQVKMDNGRLDCENSSPAAINIEELVQEINEQIMLVEQSKELLGLQNPVNELPAFLIGAQEVLRQAKCLRESSACYDRSTLKVEQEPQDKGEAGDLGSGVEAVLGEMDAIVEDVRGYNGMLEWMKHVLPQPESVKSITDLRDRVNAVLKQVETLTRDNANLTHEKSNLINELEQLQQNRDNLVEESSKEGVLLLELAALQPQIPLTPVKESLSRFELLQHLMKQQQYACHDARQRRADMETEVAFLRQHDLLLEDSNGEQQTSLSVSARVEIYARLLECAASLRLEKSEIESALNAEKNAMESSLTAEIQCRSEKLASAEYELAQTRMDMEKALAEERAFLKSSDILSSILSINYTDQGVFSRVEVYKQLRDGLDRLLCERKTVESCAAHEHEFLQSNGLLSQDDNVENNAAVPVTPALSSIRLELFQRLVDSVAAQRRHEEELVQERCFLQQQKMAFNSNEPHNSRLAVYKMLLADQNALVEEKVEREVAVEREKAFLAAHGITDFEKPIEVYEQFVAARKQLSDFTLQLEEEVRFLAEHQLWPIDELGDAATNLHTPFSSSFRLLIYRKLLQTETQARETCKQLRESMEQQLARQITEHGCVIALLTSKIERLETSLMAWQECVYASRREWDRMLLEEEDKRRSMIRKHEDAQRKTTEEHARALEEMTKARDEAVALASATHAEALEHANKEHETRLAAELQRQAQQLELAAFVHAEHESHSRTRNDNTKDTTVNQSASMSARAQLLEKFAKRDTTAISMIYKAIRLTTDILSAGPTTPGAVLSNTPSRTAPNSATEVSTDVTQSVLGCVKELKNLKEFLVQSLEQVAKDDEQVSPPFTKAPYAKWMADAVTRATADKECAIDLALCSHREFMSFAEVQLLTRQEEAEKALARVLEKLKTAAINGGFTAEQEKLLALEVEVAREREARENVDCKCRLNEEYYRRLLDERKEMEIGQTANVEGLREENKLLRVKLEKMEQLVQQQTVLPQFRPPSSNTYTSSPRASVVSPQAPRVLKSAAVSNAPMPMRPERPRGGGSAHKDRFVSDLERETGQRRTNTTARRFNGWKAREAITESPGSQLDQDFRAMQAAITSHHAPVIEPAVPTAMAAPATAPGSSLQNQELWYQGVRSIHYVSFFISIFHVPRQQLFRVEVFNSDTEQQQQTVYVTWTEMESFLQESRKAVRLGIALPADPEMAVTVPQHARAEIMDVLFERVRVYGEGTENILLGFE